MLANIELADLRREAASVKEFNKCRINQNSLLYDVLEEIPDQRFTSRKPPWLNDPTVSGINFDLAQK